MAICPTCGGTGTWHGMPSMREYAGVRLTAVQGLILGWLLHNTGKIVSRESMMAAVYGNSRNPPMDRTLDVHMVRLRRLLDGKVEIRSERGRGWWVEVA